MSHFGRRPGIPGYERRLAGLPPLPPGRAEAMRDLRNAGAARRPNRSRHSLQGAGLRRSRAAGYRPGSGDRPPCDLGVSGVPGPVTLTNGRRDGPPGTAGRPADRDPPGGFPAGTGESAGPYLKPGLMLGVLSPARPDPAPPLRRCPRPRPPGSRVTGLCSKAAAALFRAAPGQEPSARIRGSLCSASSSTTAGVRARNPGRRSTGRSSC